MVPIDVCWDVGAAWRTQCIRSELRDIGSTLSTEARAICWRYKKRRRREVLRLARQAKMCPNKRSISRPKVGATHAPGWREWKLNTEELNLTKQ